jgi:hypothetical protein
MEAPEFHEAVAALLSACGRTGRFALTRLPGGANNRAYKISTDPGDALLKVYYRHPLDPRDRLATEWVFCQFAWKNGIRYIPQPLAADPERRMALFEFVDGRELEAAEVEASHVEQAFDFYRELNTYRSTPEAAAVPAASEACFSIASHLRRVDRRIQKLSLMNTATETHRRCRAFVEENLMPVWTRLTAEVGAEARRQDLALHRELEIAERCLSPSDFGFHNALMEANGRIRFIDLEYAGWDDPAKLVCDFFCQPSVPVPRAWLPGFAAAVAATLPNAKSVIDRCALLWQVYQVKWCCIMLNNFLSDGRARRRFANEHTNQEVTLSQQLAKANRALDRLVSWSEAPASSGKSRESGGIHL